MTETIHRGEADSLGLITAMDGVAWVREYGALAHGFAVVLAGDAAATSVVHAAFVRLFRERFNPASGSNQVRVLMAVRQTCVERGVSQTPKGARWLREVAGCSKATAAAILGVGVADVQAEIQREIEGRGTRTDDAACNDARADIHDLMLDGPTTSRNAAASAHILVCTPCAALARQVKAARLLPRQESTHTSSFELGPSDFERVLETENRVRIRARILPWIVVAAVAVVVVLIWAPWSKRIPTLPGSVPASWWRGTVSSPLGGAFAMLKGFHGRTPEATVTIGPSKEFLIETKGFAVVPSKIEDGGGLTGLQRGKKGKIGFDGKDAWWEGGDDIVRHLEEDEARRVIRQSLGFLDVIERVVRGVESRTLELQGGTPDTLGDEKVTRYTVPLPGIGELVPLAKVQVMLGEDGVLRQLSTGILLVRMKRLQLAPGENPCAWESAVPNATKAEGK